MILSKFKLCIINFGTRFLLIMLAFWVVVIVTPLTAQSQVKTSTDVNTPENKEINYSIIIDSLTNELDDLKNNLFIRQEFLLDSITNVNQTNYNKLFEQLSTISSISSSNVGNTISFLELILSIIGVFIAIFSIAGYAYVKQKFEKLQKGYEDKFNQKSREFEIMIEESRGNFYFSLRYFRQAADIFNKILTFDPENFYAHEKLGFLYTGDVLNNPDRAINHCMEALRINPDAETLYLNLLVASGHAKRPFHEIDNIYKKAIKKFEGQHIDDMIMGKLKLFYADGFSAEYPKKLKEAEQIYNEAIDHFNKISKNNSEKERWLRQAQEGLDRLKNPKQ